MHFNVEGPEAKGVVNVHMVKMQGENEWEYRFLALDVPGHQRIWVENRENAVMDKKSGKMFGVRWW
jgi:import inner membrane translocase subunit TIM21